MKIRMSSWLLLTVVIALSLLAYAGAGLTPLKKPAPRLTKPKQVQVKSRHIYYRNKAVVLIYHDVDNQECGTAISPERFASHMKMLADNGFAVISLNDVVAFAEKGQAIPANAVAITLDDGCVSNYQVVYPALQARKWPMTIFVTVSEIGGIRSNGLRRLNWAELVKMRQAGVLVGSHTYAGHTQWINKNKRAYWLTDRLENESQQHYQARVLKDLTYSRQKLEEHLQSPVTHFAFPFGAHSGTAVQLAQEAGYKYIWTTERRPVLRHSSLTSLGRVSVGIKGTTAEQLKTVILNTANRND